MKIAIYPHDLGVGGSQLNAIEIAAELQRRGHEMVLVGRPGPLVTRAEHLGLEFVELPAPARRPSRRVVKALRQLVADRGLDIVHGFEWPPSLEAVWACQGTAARPCSTVMSMAVAPFIPRWVPLLVGTEQILAVERSSGRTRVGLLEPPVDLASNDPDLDFGTSELRASWGFAPEDVVLGMVTRLAHEMKLEGILTAIEVVGRSDQTQYKLVIAGDGPGRPDVERAIRHLPSRGRERIVITGELSDPRPVYAASDVSLGMGGSALRALAFATPLIVQGEQGFWRLLDHESLPDFLWTGWYGAGSGRESGRASLTEELAKLGSVQRRKELADLGRGLVEERFSVATAADRQETFYADALERSDPGARRAVGNAAALVRYSGYYARKRWRRLRGSDSSDDFNARPVASTPQAGR